MLMRDIWIITHLKKASKFVRGYSQDMYRRKVDIVNEKTSHGYFA